MYYYAVSTNSTRMEGAAPELTYRLIAGIPALLPKGLLEQVNIVLVSAKQKQIAVELHGVCHVIRDEIVVPAQGSREPLLIHYRRQIHKAGYGRDVLLPLLLAQIAPVSRVSVTEGYFQV